MNVRRWQKNELEQSIQPVRLLLTKVSKKLHNILLSDSGFSAAKDRLCD